MNPFKNIENAKRVLNKKTKSIKYSKDIVKESEDLNVLIDLVNSFESMLIDKYKTDTIETLLYNSMYEKLLKDFDSDGVDIGSFMHSILTDIDYGSELKKAQVVSILKHKEMEYKLSNNNNLTNWIDFDTLLNKTIKTIKLNIKWRRLK